MDLNAALRDAAARNDVAEAQRLIEAGADVNARSNQQESAYLLAASTDALVEIDEPEPGRGRPGCPGRRRIKPATASSSPPGSH